MALQMQRETPDGVVHPASYWRIVEVDIDVQARRVEVFAAGYHDATAAGAGRAQIERRRYAFTGEAVQPILAAVRGQTPGVSALAAAYAAVRGTKDVDDGSGVLVGFFDKADDV